MLSVKGFERPRGTAENVVLDLFSRAWGERGIGADPMLQHDGLPATSSDEHDL